MAKKSSIEKNERRRRLVKRYEARREALKTIVMDQARPIEERFEAQLKLAELPRNSSRTRIAQMRRKTRVTTPASKLRQRVLDVLQSEGYIRGYSMVEYGDGKSELDIELKYYEGEPVIREIERVSKPGRRVYSSVRDLPRVNNGLGVSIISTPKGVMSDAEAREQNVGGEVLCRIF